MQDQKVMEKTTGEKEEFSYAPGSQGCTENRQTIFILVLLPVI